jgi:hypothetical protein
MKYLKTYKLFEEIYFPVLSVDYEIPPIIKDIITDRLQELLDRNYRIIVNRNNYSLTIQIFNLEGKQYDVLDVNSLMVEDLISMSHDLQERGLKLLGFEARSIEGHYTTWSSSMADKVIFVSTYIKNLRVKIDTSLLELLEYPQEISKIELTYSL